MALIIANNAATNLKYPKKKLMSSQEILKKLLFADFINLAIYQIIYLV